MLLVLVSVRKTKAIVATAGAYSPGTGSYCWAWLRRETGFDPWVGKIPWRREWQPTPGLLPRKLHGQRSLVGYSPWGRKDSDMTERLHFTCVYCSLCSPRLCPDAISCLRRRFCIWIRAFEVEAIPLRLWSFTPWRCGGGEKRAAKNGMRR